MEQTSPAEGNPSPLTCQWQDCNQPFPDHTTLASHLSENHVQWSKHVYKCFWKNCARFGVPCLNRFAMIMHLRNHTGEKPFECTHPNCGQLFNQADALAKHVHTDHAEHKIEKKQKKEAYKSKRGPPKRTSAFISSDDENDNTFNDYVKKADINNDKIINDTLNNKDNEETDTSNEKMDKINVKNDKDNNDQDKVDQKLLQDTTSDYSQFRLARLQLNYLLRENEMLQDDYEYARKKLKRLRTERRVLLDTAMSYSQQ